MKINTEETLSGPVISLTFTTEDSVNELKNERGFIVGLTPAEAAELRNELTRALDKIAPKTRAPADVLTDPQPGASPIMDAVRAQPGLEHVKGADAELLLTLLRSRQGWEPVTPRWSHVRLMAGHGSTVGHALCVAAGIDPNETAPPLDEENCKRCGSYLLDREDEEDEETSDVPPPAA